MGIDIGLGLALGLGEVFALSAGGPMFGILILVLSVLGRSWAVAGTLPPARSKVPAIGHGLLLGFVAVLTPIVAVWALIFLSYSSGHYGP